MVLKYLVITNRSNILTEIQLDVIETTLKKVAPEKGQKKNKKMVGRMHTCVRILFGLSVQEVSHSCEYHGYVQAICSCNYLIIPDRSAWGYDISDLAFVGMDYAVIEWEESI